MWGQARPRPPRLRLLRALRECGRYQCHYSFHPDPSLAWAELIQGHRLHQAVDPHTLVAQLGEQVGLYEYSNGASPFQRVSHRPLEHPARATTLDTENGQIDIIGIEEGTQSEQICRCWLFPLQPLKVQQPRRRDASRVLTRVQTNRTQAPTHSRILIQIQVSTDSHIIVLDKRSGLCQRKRKIA